MNGKTLKIKLTSIALVVAMMLAALGIAGMTTETAYAAENEITVYVTVSNAGELATDAGGNVAANLPVTVAADESGLATVDAALAALHETYYPGGYVTSESAYGLAVDKLWGVENGGSYLFAIDGVGCNSGVGYDYIGDGQYLTAIVMKDLTYWSDLVAAFDKRDVTVKAGEEVELALTYDAVAYDENWNATHVATPVVGANVYVTGAADTVLATTDTMGKAFVSFDEAGTYVVTASGAVSTEVTTDWQTGATAPFEAPISAPACVITVEADELVVEEDQPAVEEDKDEPAVEEDEPAVEEDKDEPAVEEDDEPAVEEDDEEAATEEDEEPAAEEDTEKSPATGDASQLAVYLMVLMAAAGTVICTVRKQK